MNEILRKEIEAAVQSGDKKFLAYVVESVLLRRELERIKDVAPSIETFVVSSEESAQVQ